MREWETVDCPQFSRYRPSTSSQQSLPSQPCFMFLLFSIQPQCVREYSLFFERSCIHCCDVVATRICPNHIQQMSNVLLEIFRIVKFIESSWSLRFSVKPSKRCYVALTDLNYSCWSPWPRLQSGSENNWQLEAWNRNFEAVSWYWSASRG